PKNITHLRKVNGGLSSSRNYGLDYIDDNNLSFDYVTFTDPDDILNKDYFLELDKFFTKHPSCQIASCNLIYFYEKGNVFKDIHPLKYRYNSTHVVNANNFGDDIILSSATAVYKTSLLKDIPIRFDEKLKPSFEDCKFNNQLIVAASNIEVGFIKESKYFYRQRQDNSSLMNGSWSHEGLFSSVLSDGVLKMLTFANQSLGYVPLHIQRVALFHCIGYYRRLLNAKHHISFLSTEQIDNFQHLLREIFSFIDESTIVACTFPNLQQKHKIGLLSLYKNKRYPVSYVYINRIDTRNKILNFSFFTGFTDDELVLRLDNAVQNVLEEKFITNTFLDDNLFYERRFTLSYQDEEQVLDISINNKKANLTSFTKGFTGGDKISVLIDCMNKKFIFPTVKNSWIIMDRKDKADDNAEHFYRYIMNNHPEQEIYFAINKDSTDWERLSKDGFNLLDFNSGKFIRELKQCKYIVSSHLFIWNSLANLKGPQSLTNKRKIWLQHGVICNDNSNVVNTKEIDLMITSTKPEYDSIVKSFGTYNLLPSQLVISGLPRHDLLLEKDKSISTSKNILVMPTWRTWLNGMDIKETSYFENWNNFLMSEKLHQLLKKHGYRLIFAPHKEVNDRKHLFFTNEYIHVWDDSSESMQDLFAKSEIMITDYSSVAFEMGFLGKLVFYFQFDSDAFFSKHYQKGYFDFVEDGFGPVSHNINDLYLDLESYFKDKKKFKKSYKGRMSIFDNKGKNSNEIIYNKVMLLN
ncbi:MAG: CDP-glycerol glycerophosphotransferase family protein, partial [Pasteurella oralis]|uniref:CDP-glycerol:glycerophosphate glycerophosphotransferase n=1 Tax=Pasteurella oralis TaxID=1071947 RepID=UPI0026FE6DA4|nr:CDP-glycerol glycerophosphotransferase family protein [Pasteurella oralis]